MSMPMNMGIQNGKKIARTPARTLAVANKGVLHAERLASISTVVGAYPGAVNTIA
jgi:hypothetical protein